MCFDLHSVTVNTFWKKYSIAVKRRGKQVLGFTSDRTSFDWNGHNWNTSLVPDARIALHAENTDYEYGT